MPAIISAACGCDIGKIRKNNEDNFYFDERCLAENNNGLKHTVTMERSLEKECCVAIFDGMGGEQFGEIASFAAADGMRGIVEELSRYVIQEKKYLTDMCQKLNESVLVKKRELCTEHMGTTMVAACFSHGYVYICNLGDSRAYRLRGEVFQQLSEDHVLREERLPKKKAPLTQYLGIPSDEYLLEPYIVKGKLQAGDQYLLCSDGLTDMLTNLEIADILLNADTAEASARRLLDAALDAGGRDNITVIVCSIL